MSFWQPKSVLQLLLLGFLIVVAPLGLAIMHTVQTLGDLSEKNRAVTAKVISLNRQGQGLQRDLLDLERRGRQYQALKNDELLDLFQREREMILVKLNELELLVEKSPSVLAQLRQQLVSLEPGRQNPDVLIEQFSQVADARFAASEWLKDEVDFRITAHAQESDRIKDSLLLMVLLMVLATLSLMLFFGYWINRPIQNIVEKIERLGHGDLGKAITVSGPQEIRDVGLQLEWLRSRLDKIDQQKLQFLRHMSHELKTPLANLREGSDLLAEEVLGGLTRQQQEVVTIVQRNSIELQRLIENLLDYTHLSDQVLNPEPVIITELASALLQNYRMSIESKGLRMTTQLDDSEIMVDKQKLKVALDNLISNAVNYTPENGEIEITGGIDRGLLDLSVANSGSAIPEQEREHLFKPFYQGSSVRRGPIKGSGIGLSVAQESIEAQGGSLQLVDHASLAVCFRLICPLQEQ
ncbi:MAG: HAMP domain-containing histidine kinase [Pseudomonadales bacterium]|nr:HAMP domain-containing histidine kinase [Pseudomonadales bacterium]MCP5172068.1 HAMP domain-containing histidine kinase [Pseudomonadales bacterium]